MAIAIWDMTTYTTGVTLYGITGRWITLPDAFQTLGYMLTTTPVKTVNPYGLFIEYLGSTSPFFAATNGGYVPVVGGVKVNSYMKGARSFLVNDPCDTVLASASGGLAVNTLHPGGIRRFILYYRAMGEFGEVPA